MVDFSPAESLCLFSLNYKTAPLEVRERFNFSSRRLKSAFEFCEQKNLRAVIVSTCNRVEVYLRLERRGQEHEVLRQLFQFTHDLELSDYESHFSFKYGLASAEHLFRLAAGLESMVTGETEIIGQLRDAYRRAQTAAITGARLNGLFEAALKAGKRVRTDTKLGCVPVSVSSVAVELAENLFGSLEEKQVVVLGAGQMSELTCRQLYSRGVSAVVVSSRRFDSAKNLADKFAGRAVQFDQLEAALVEADIIISQTAAPHPIVDHELLRHVSDQKSASLLIIDLAVPRDVSPEVARLERVTLYNIDDLRGIASDNEACREKEIIACEKIITAELQTFERFLARREINTTLKALDEYASAVLELEFQRLQTTPPAGLDFDELRCSLERSLNKVLHPFRETLPALEADLVELEKSIRENLNKIQQGNS